MPQRAVALAALGAVLLAPSGCGQPPPGERKSPAPATPVRKAPDAPRVALVESVPLATGLRLTLTPNLPGVSSEDMPLAARRDVEVLGFDGKRLRLKWSGRIRRETGESARRREDWVRKVARSGGPPGTPPPADYEEAQIGGTLEFPDFAVATTILLPGLWPEGRAVIPEASAIWLPAAVRERLLAEASSRMAVLPISSILLEPAASLLRAAADVARDAERPQDPELLMAGPAGRVRVRLDGSEAELPAIEARSFLGRYQVLLDEANPLVTSLLPETVPSIFAPARVLSGLLGYRVSAIASAEPPRARAGS